MFTDTQPCCYTIWIDEPTAYIRPIPPADVLAEVFGYVRHEFSCGVKGRITRKEIRDSELLPEVGPDPEYEPTGRGIFSMGLVSDLEAALRARGDSVTAIDHRVFSVCSGPSLPLVDLLPNSEKELARTIALSERVQILVNNLHDKAAKLALIARLFSASQYLRCRAWGW